MEQTKALIQRQKSEIGLVLSAIESQVDSLEELQRLSKVFKTDIFSFSAEDVPTRYGTQTMITIHFANGQYCFPAKELKTIKRRLTTSFSRLNYIGKRKSGARVSRPKRTTRPKAQPKIVHAPEPEKKQTAIIRIFRKIINKAAFLY